MKILKSTFMIVLILSLVMIAGVASAAETSANLKATLLNQDPDSAEPGEYVELRWKIENLAEGKMEDVSYTLNVKYPFSFDDSDSAVKTLGDISGYTDDDDYVTLFYKVRVDEDAIEDTYELDLVLDGNFGGQNINKVSSFDVRVGNKKKAVFGVGQIISSPVKLYADTEENKLDITFENIGDENAEVVTVDLILPEGFTPTYGYSNRANLGTVQDSSSKVATFYMDVEDFVAEGNFEATAKITYKDGDSDSNDYKTIELPLNLPVKGKPTFEVESVVFEPIEYKAGDKVTMRTIVKNIGSKEADAVSLRSFKETSQPFEFDDKSDFIGKLMPGESGEAILTFTVDEDAKQKDYLLDLQVRGIYNHEVFVNDATGKISVIASDKRKNVTVSLISVIGITLFSVIMGFLFGRKSRR